MQSILYTSTSRAIIFSLSFAQLNILLTKSLAWHGDAYSHNISYMKEKCLAVLIRAIIHIPKDHCTVSIKYLMLQVIYVRPGIHAPDSGSSSICGRVNSVTIQSRYVHAPSVSFYVCRIACGNFSPR